MWNDAAVCTMKETVDMYGWYLTRIMSDCCEKKNLQEINFVRKKFFVPFFVFFLI